MCQATLPWTWLARTATLRWVGVHVCQHVRGHGRLFAFRFPKSTVFLHQVVGLLLRSGQFSQEYLQRSDMPHAALLLAAKQGNNEVIGLLVKHGFDVNRKLPSNQGTCLHEAALYGKVDTVRYLLQVRPSAACTSGVCDCLFLCCSVVLMWQL